MSIENRIENIDTVLSFLPTFADSQANLYKLDIENSLLEPYQYSKQVNNFIAQISEESKLMQRITVIQGDITQQRVDAIVNAANESLLGGGGVDGAIHTAAGAELLKECRQLHGCATGAAKITKGYNLPAKWIIHTVGPVWQGGNQGEDDLLASCYRSCLAIAQQYQIETIAFPAISTGVYRFPVERAAKIAVTEIHQFLTSKNLPKQVILVCFSQISYDCYLRAKQQISERQLD